MFRFSVFIFGFVIAFSQNAAVKADELSKIMFTPKIWAAQMVMSDTGENGYNDSVFMPLYGGALSFAFESGSVFSLTGLYGSGSSEYKISNFSNRYDMDFERYDVQALLQMPLATPGINVFVKGDYVNIRHSMKRKDENPSIAVGTTTAANEYNFYMVGGGAGISRAIDAQQNHNLFGNIALMAGLRRLSHTGLNYNYSESDFATGLDANFGYAYNLMNLGTLSARYRVYLMSTPFSDTDDDSQNIIHGPELNMTMRW